MTARLSSFRTDDSAVSPVIGTLLMVSITVILAAVIGSFVLGLGAQFDGTPPRALISIQDVNASQHELTFHHEGRDHLVADQTTIKVLGPTGGDEFTIRSDSPAQFGTGDRFVLNTNRNASGSGSRFIPSGDWGSGTWEMDLTGTPFTFSSGNSLRVMFVDEPSGQIVVDRAISA